MTLGSVFQVDQRMAFVWPCLCLSAHVPFQIMLDVFQRLTSLLLYWCTQTFEGMPQQMLDLLFQFQIRRLKKL